MSKMGRVVQEIMEKFDGRVPQGYTLEDYFRDKEKEEAKSKHDKDVKSENQKGD